MKRGYSNGKSAVAISLLSILVIVLLIFNTREVSSSAYYNITEGMVLWYHFDNNSAYGENATNSYDFSGNGRNGTAYNASVLCGQGDDCPLWNSVSGKFGAGGWNFDGVNDYISTGNIANFQSVAFWIKPGTRTSYDTYFQHKNFSIFADDHGWLFFGDWDTSQDRISDIDLDDYQNNWTFIAVSTNGTNYTVYVNGASLQSGNYSRSVSSSPIYLGTYATNGLHSLNGSIDELMVWNRSLSASEILLLYGLNTSASSLKIWDDSDSITTYANLTKFYANYTSGTVQLNTSSQYCEFRQNKTGLWKFMGNMSYNYSTKQYEFYGDCGYLKGHSCLPVGNYSYNISCYDLTGSYQNVSVTDPTVISSYSTTLAASNESAQYKNGNHFFYANFTRTGGFGIQGMNSELGNVVWNTSDIDSSQQTVSIAFYDIDSDGYKDELLVGGGGTTGVTPYYKNGTRYYGGAWPAEDPVGRAYNIIVADLNNDSYLNEFAVSDDSPALRVYNSSGNETFRFNVPSSGTDRAYGLLVSDFDNQGFANDLAVTGGFYQIPNHTLTILNSTVLNMTNWAVYWNFSDGEDRLISGDFDRDGNKNDLFFTERYLMNENGSIMANITIQITDAQISIGSGDIDHDGFEDEVVLAGRYATTYTNYIYIYEWNGTWNANYNSTSYNSRTALDYYVGAGLVTDLDEDGYKDDMIIGEYDMIEAFDNNSNLLWAFSDVNLSDYIYELKAADLNGDGYKEIFAGGGDGVVWILNQSGTLLGKFNVRQGDIGSGYSLSAGTDSGDINGDGLSDFAMSASNGYGFVFQDSKCQIVFNDTNVFYNMTWNQTSRRWESNRTFNSSISYTYNITCSKGGYETQTSANQVITVQDSAQLSVNSTADSAATYPNWTIVYANYSYLGLPATNNSNNNTCQLRFNVTGSWSEAFSMDYNSTLNEWQIIADGGYLPGHMRGLPSGNYSLNITCNNSISGSLVNLTYLINVSSYVTALSASNDSVQYNSQRVMFFANYSKTGGYGVQAMGSEIGRVIWNRTTTTGQAVRGGVDYADMDNDGKRDEFIVNDYLAFEVYDHNGSLIWSKYKTSAGYSWYIRSGDFDHDGYQDDFIAGEGSKLVIYNNSGSVWFNASIDGTFLSLGFSDTNKDGMPDLIATGSSNVSIFNYTGSTWQNIANFTIEDNVQKVAFGDFNGDSKEDEIAVIDRESGNVGAGDLYIIYPNGSQIWSALNFGQFYLYDFDTCDFNRDGTKEFVAAGARNNLIVFNKSGSNIWNTTASDYVYEATCTDLDNSGYKDDFIFSDGTTTNGVNSSGTKIISYAMDANSISAGDVNNDGLNEIVIGATNLIYLLNNSGNITSWTQNITGEPGYDDKGQGPGTTVFDINKDGILDIGVGTQTPRVYGIQDVNCQIVFNDSSVLYNMTWNVSSKLWEYNRTFNASVNYTYNITCSKNGYQPQNYSAIIWVQTASSNLAAWDDSDSITTYANLTKFYANYTSGTVQLNTSSQYCEFRQNKTGLWKFMGNMSYNYSTKQYEFYGDCGYLKGHSCLPVGNYSYNISCYDLTGSYNSNSLWSNVSISNYPTNLSVLNDSNTVNLQVKFSANFSRIDNYRLNGIDKVLGRILWNTTNLDGGDANTYTVSPFDLNHEGKLNDLVVGSRPNTFVFFGNGSKSNQSLNHLIKYETVAFDADNDSYFDEIAAADYNGKIYVLDRNMTVLWNYTVAGDRVISIGVGALDSDGLKDDIIAGTIRGNFSFFNKTSNNPTNWSLLSNISNDTLSISSNAYIMEVAIKDLDRDGIGELVASVANAGNNYKVFVFFKNGTQFWSARGHGAMGFVDADNGGIDDDVFATNAMTGLEGISIYNETGGALFNSSSLINDASEENWVTDLDLDGRQEIFAGHNYGRVEILYNNATNISRLQPLIPRASQDWTRGISIADFNADGWDEISYTWASASNSSSQVLMFDSNLNGSFKWDYNINQGTTGQLFGKNGGFKSLDINDDGILEIAVASTNGYAHIIQDSICRITFNDSIILYNMTWNESSRLWEFNRTFNSTLNYTYNITCSKGGYQIQNYSDIIAIQSLSPPNLTIISPLNQSYSTKNILVNLTNSSNAQATWWFNGTGNMTYTIPVYFNFSEGSNLFYAYANESGGNTNTTNVTFYVDSVYPVVNTTYPLNNSNYSLANLEINYTLTEINPQTCKWSSNLGETNTTITCGNNITGQTWSQGGNNITIWANDSLGNENLSSVYFFIDSVKPVFSNNITSPSGSPTYGALQSYQFNVTWTDSNGISKAVINFNGTNYTMTNNTNEYYYNLSDLSAGNYSYYFWANDTFGNENLSLTYNFSINKASPSFSVLVTTTAVYETASDYNASESNSGDNGCVYNLTRGGIQIATGSSVSDNTVLGVGNHTYNYSTAGCQNYTTNSDSKTLTISKATGRVYVYLNHSRSNISIIKGSIIYVNASLNKGVGTITLSNNGTIINSGASPLSNLTNFSSIGSYNITGNYDGNENYTAGYETFWVNAGSGDSIAPNVSIISPLNTSNYVTASVDFKINVSDNIGISSCRFALSNGLVNYTLSNTTADIYLASNNSIAYGTYSVRYYCNDTAGNMNDSQTMTFYITSPVSTNTTSTTTPSFSSGGGSTMCTTQWKCTDWGFCDKDSKQYRECVKEQPYCSISESKPEETRECAKVLFDISTKLNIRKISADEPLHFETELINKNGTEKVDVMIKYIIFDQNGSNIYTFAETRAVEGSLKYSRDLEQLNLPAGNYNLEVTIEYGKNQIAGTKEPFTISPKKSFNKMIIVYAVLGILVILDIILAICYVFRRFSSHNYCRKLKNILHKNHKHHMHHHLHHHLHHKHH